MRYYLLKKWDWVYAETIFAYDDERILATMGHHRTTFFQDLPKQLGTSWHLHRNPTEIHANAQNIMSARKGAPDFLMNPRMLPPVSQLDIEMEVRLIIVRYIKPQWDRDFPLQSFQPVVAAENYLDLHGKQLASFVPAIICQAHQLLCLRFNGVPTIDSFRQCVLHVESALYGLQEMNVEGTWEDVYSEYLDPLTLLRERLDEYETEEESDAESEDGRANPQEA
jgi:hypothetical protein